MCGKDCSSSLGPWLLRCYTIQFLWRSSSENSAVVTASKWNLSWNFSVSTFWCTKFWYDYWICLVSFSRSRESTDETWEEKFLGFPARSLLVTCRNSSFVSWLCTTEKEVGGRKSCCVWLSFGRQQILPMTGKQWWNAANVNHTPRTRSKSKDELIHLVLALGLGVKIKILLFLLYTDCKHGRKYFLFSLLCRGNPDIRPNSLKICFMTCTQGKSGGNEFKLVGVFCFFFEAKKKHKTRNIHIW